MGKMNELSLVVDRVNEITRGFFGKSEQEQEVLRTEYRNVLQPALLAAYGEDAYCHMVDPWMAETFSDLYKDRNGIRPRGFSYKYMAEWMANIPPLEDGDEIYADDEDEVDGDRFDPDISQWGKDEDEIAAAARDFEEVYGVSAMGQALKFHGMVEGY